MKSKKYDSKKMNGVHDNQTYTKYQTFDASRNAQGTIAQGEDKKRRNRNLLIIGIICVVIAVLLAVLSFCSNTWFDDDATFVSFEGMTDEEINDELNRQVDKGMMNIQIASTITFQDGSSEGAARIKNTEANERDMKVVITLDSTGEVVYESGAIGPGQGIEKIRLATSLPEGSYKATAMFTGYNLETHKEMGSAGAAINLEVLS